MHAASAATVSLTGSCPTATLNNTSNIIHFNLTNSGDVSPTDVVIMPSIYGADVSPNSVPVPSLSPNSTSETFYLSNFSSPGGYVGVFNVKYSQAGSTFFTAFPCYYYVDNATVAKVSILNVTLKKSGNNTDTATVSVFNFGDRQIQLDLSTFAPLNFNIAPNSYNMTLGPGSKKNVTFNISELSTGSLVNASFVIGFYAQYMNGSMHYSTFPYLAYYTEKNVKSSSLWSHPLILIVSIVFVIAIIVAFIVASLLVNRKRSRKIEG